MRIEDFELADTAVLVLKAADGKKALIGMDGKTPAEIELYSPGSPQGVAADASFNRKNNLRTFRAMRGIEPTDKDEIDARRDVAERLAGYTKEIRNLPVTDAVAFYLNTRLTHITRQVPPYIGDLENFSKGPTESSPSQ